MKQIKLTIIGAGSDLIEPLISNKYEGINIQKITRSQWDLSEKIPSQKLISEIISFAPNQLLFAAGVNKKIDLNDIKNEDLINLVDNHLSINCVSLISIVHLLQNNLPNKLDAVHAISSLYGLYGRKNRLPYSVSKHALEASIKCLSLEYPETQFMGYRPGFFKTKLTSANLTKEMQDELSKRIGKKRFGTPLEMSKVLLNNIRNTNPYQTGTFITIDGGMISGGIFDS